MWSTDSLTPTVPAAGGRQVLLWLLSHRSVCGPLRSGEPGDLLTTLGCSAKTYGNGSEVRIPYRVVTGTTAIKYDHKMVSTSALTKDRYSAALLKTDLPPRVSRYHLFRHMDAVFSAIVAEEQTSNAGADGRRLIESDARLAAAERAQEKLKRDNRALERKIERNDRASKRAVHAQYVKGRTMMTRNGYSADQVHEELGSEPEYPESLDEDSEESEEESDLSDS